MMTTQEKLKKIATFDNCFRVWIKECRADGISDEQIINDLHRLVKLVEVKKETKEVMIEVSK